MRVLIVEDDARVADLVSDVLRAEGIDVEVTQTGADGLVAVSSGRFDLMVLDIELPGLSGMEVLEKLRREDDDLPVLMLTGRNTSEDIVGGLDAGADDYLTKPFDVRVLLARVEAIARRAERAASSVLRLGYIKLDQIQRKAWRDGRSLRLTPKEFEVLRLLLTDPGRVLDREQLLRQVWKMDFDPETNLVEVTISRLRAKLESGGLPRILQRHEGGYRLSESA